MREELEAYARVNTSLGVPGEVMGRTDPAEAQKSLAKRICRVVAEKSVFPKVAMLLRNAEGRVMCMGSVGVDDLTLAKLQGWGEQVVTEERQGGPAKSIRPGAASFSIPLGEWADFDREVCEWAMEGKRERAEVAAGDCGADHGLGDARDGRGGGVRRWSARQGA